MNRDGVSNSEGGNPSSFSCQFQDGSSFELPNDLWRRAFESRYRQESWDPIREFLTRTSGLVLERIDRDPFQIEDIEEDIGLDSVGFYRVEEEVGDLITDSKDSDGQGSVTQAEIAYTIMYQYLRVPMMGIIIADRSNGQAGVVGLNGGGGATVYSNREPIPLKDFSVLFDPQSR